MLQMLHGEVMRQRQGGEGFKSVQETVTRLQRESEARAMTALNESIDKAAAGMKAKFPSLFDGGKQQETLESKAAQFIEAAALGGKKMTVEEAMLQAAQVLTFPDLEKRAQAQVVARARRSAAATVPTPGTAGPSQPRNADEAFERGLEEKGFV